MISASLISQSSNKAILRGANSWKMYAVRMISKCDTSQSECRSRHSRFATCIEDIHYGYIAYAFVHACNIYVMQMWIYFLTTTLRFGLHER